MDLFYFLDLADADEEKEVMALLAAEGVLEEEDGKSAEDIEKLTG